MNKAKLEVLRLTNDDVIATSCDDPKYNDKSPKSYMAISTSGLYGDIYAKTDHTKLDDGEEIQGNNNIFTVGNFYHTIGDVGYEFVTCTNPEHRETPVKG